MQVEAGYSFQSLGLSEGDESVFLQDTLKNRGLQNKSKLLYLNQQKKTKNEKKFLYII